MVFFSLAAFWGMVVITARAVQTWTPLCPPETEGRTTGKCVCATALAGFIFLPPGSLPPLCNTAWGGVAAFICLAFSFLPTGKKQTLLPLAALGLTGVAVAFFAWTRGVPGSIANMGTFVAVPIWTLVTLPEAIGCIFLGGGSLLAAKALVAFRPSGFCSAIRAVLLGALWISLFIPWNCLFWGKAPLALAALADLLFFWVKSGLVAFWFIRSRLRGTALPGAVCCLMGSLAVLWGAW